MLDDHVVLNTEFGSGMLSIVPSFSLTLRVGTALIFTSDEEEDEVEMETKSIDSKTEETLLAKQESEEEPLELEQIEGDVVVESDPDNPNGTDFGLD